MWEVHWKQHDQVTCMASTIAALASTILSLHLGLIIGHFTYAVENKLPRFELKPKLPNKVLSPC